MNVIGHDDRRREATEFTGYRDAMLFTLGRLGVGRSLNITIENTENYIWGQFGDRIANLCPIGLRLR
jgi:hypothetical protein